MKKSELKAIIRECIEEIALDEKAPHRPRVVTQGNGHTSGRYNDTYYADRMNTQEKYPLNRSGGEQTYDYQYMKRGPRKGKLHRSEIKRRKERYKIAKNERDTNYNMDGIDATSYINSQGRRVMSPRKSTYKKSGVGK